MTAQPSLAQTSLAQTSLARTNLARTCFSQAEFNQSKFNQPGFDQSEFSPPPASTSASTLGSTARLARSGRILTASLAHTARFKALVGLLAFAALWEIAPRIGLVDALFVPPLSVVLHTLLHNIENGQLVRNTLASLARAVPGLLLAITLAVPAGIFFGQSRLLRQIFGPIIEIFRNTSALALLPVFTLLLGIGETSKITMVLYAAAWPIFLSTINGVNGVDPVLVKAGRSLGLTKAGLFVHIIIPAALPSILTGIRLASASSLLVLVAAEMVGSRAGLGYLINASQLDFDIPGMYAGIITLSAIGGMTNFLLLRLERHFLSWKQS